MSFAFETHEGWQDELREVRDRLLAADYAEPERKYLRKVSILVRYAARAAQMTSGLKDALRWERLATWAQTCHDVYLDAMWGDRDRCICGGDPSPDTWEKIGGLDMPEWWGDAEKRVQAMDVVGDGKIRAVVWCDRGGEQ